MTSILKNSIKFSLFLSITLLLLWLVYRDVDINDVFVLLRHDINYWWLLVASIVGVLSHLIRAVRWQMMTKSMGYKIDLFNSFMAVMVGYFANMAIPRMGELTRCSVITKYEKMPFSKLLGSIVTERVFDMIVLIVCTIIVVVSQFGFITRLLASNPDMISRVENSYKSLWLYVGIAFMLLFLCFVWYFVRSGRLGERMSQFLRDLWHGVISVKNIENRGLFIFYTIAIWLCYFLMLYFTFFCFDFTSDISPMIALTIFVLGSYGMLAPVQGGVGAWHFMVIAGLVLYFSEISDIRDKASVFALIAHGGMTLLYIVLGALSLIVLPLYNHKRRLSS